jgi:TRAP-type uncharacterized transport system fused permease subunit
VQVFAFKLERSHGGLVRLAATVIAVAMVVYHMWIIAFGAPEAILFRGMHLLFALTLVFLLYRLPWPRTASRESPRLRIARSAPRRFSTCFSTTATS